MFSPSMPPRRAATIAASSAIARMRIFGAEIDEALRRADGEAGDRHPFDQHEGIALHDHAVGKGAAVALVGVADDVFLVGAGEPTRCPT